jgi:hypothetical protein
MSNICRSKLLVIASISSIISFVFPSCSPVKIKEVTIQRADYYRFSSKKAGLKISVDPYREENRLTEFFGCDLLSRGVLPVLIVIENQNAEDGYILVKEKSALVLKTTNLTNTGSNLGTGSYDSHDLEEALKAERGATLLTGGVTMVFPVVGVALLPLAIIAQKKADDEIAIKRNIEKTQLLDKTIYQGGSHSGFLYFQFKTKEDINRVAGFSLSMTNIRTNEIVSFIIAID